jgi:hypothetical protein
VILDEVPETGVAFLLLGHAGLGVLLLAHAFSAPRLQTLTIRAAAVAGVILSVSLGLAGRGDAAWRGFDLGPERTLIAAVAIACAWVIVGAGAAMSPRTERAALIGTAGSALALWASGQWLVPSLLYAVVVATASVVLMLKERRRVYGWLGIALALGGTVAAFTVWWLDAQTWDLPFALSGWERWLLAGSVVLFAGAPLLGAWANGAQRGSEAVPIVAGLGFLLLVRPAVGEQPWVGASLLVLGFLAYLWSSWSERKIGAAAGWPFVVGLAFILIAPQVAPAIAVATLLLQSTLVLMPSARPALPLFMLPHLPLTAGFAAALVVGETAFRRAVDTEDVVDAIPWSVVVVILPLLAAAALLLCRRLILRGAGGPRLRDAQIGVGVLAAASVGFALFPEASFIGDGLPLEEVVLFGLAGAVAIGAVLVARRGTTSQPTPEEPLLEPEPGPRFVRPTAVVAALLSVGSVGCAAYLLVEGLKLGFL